MKNMHVLLDCFLHVCLALFLISFLEFLDLFLELVSRFFRESVSCFPSFFVLFKSVLKSEVQRENAIAKVADGIVAIQKKTCGCDAWPDSQDRAQRDFEDAH